jgi:predicted ATP-dependent protease
LIERSILLLNFSGLRVGQINGLSYYRLGGFAFGQPVRITARVGLGSGRIIDIEREVNLGGPIHAKGVLILTGYINGHFAQNDSISLSASLVFEQSYGSIEGDSATAAEACALLSAIANVPLAQSIAITGSMNQHGEIQPIGGINEKIEGFFDICQAQGFTGEHGVIIPHANIDNLMLRKDIVLAASKKLFHVYAVKNIDEALSILTGKEAGTRNSAGRFPAHSINAKVAEALRSFAKKANPPRRTTRKPLK